MQPSHRKKAFQAQRVFTDREHPIGLFKTAFDGSQGIDDYKVIGWYGIGGQGKTALAREIKRLATEQLPKEHESVKCAFAKVDLETAKNRSAIQALLSIRLQLGKTFGSKFPCFDVGFARYFAETQPGIDIREKHPELFKGESELLQDLIDLADDEIEKIFGVGTLYKWAMRKGREALEWYNQQGKDILNGLDHLDDDQIIENLPKYLGADIYILKEKYPDARIAIAFDAYEAFWRDYNSKDSVENAHADAWVRQFVKETPGVLILVFGRDKLRWDEVDTDFVGVVETHVLGGLSDADADLFLQRVPVDEESIRERIVTTSAGLPFYLDIQVSQYEKLRSSDGVVLEEFATSEAGILPRFWNHLDAREQEYARFMSYPFDLSEGIANVLVEAFPGALGLFNWGWFKRQSFMYEDDNGEPIMHNLMKAMIQARERDERPERFKHVHSVLFDSYKEKAQPENISSINISHELAMEAAVRHRWLSGSEFFTWFIEHKNVFSEARRTNLLFRIYLFLVRVLTESKGEEHPDTLTARHGLAEQIGNQGRHQEAEAMYRAIWKIRRRPDVLGKEHPDTLFSRNNLAWQIGKQGRYQEAEAELRAIRKIQRRPDVLGEGHPDTLTTLSYLAWQIGQQGRYQEAEAMYHDIWKIQRRPDVLGEEHPDTLTTRNDLAFFIASQGRYQEAEAEFLAIWEIERRPDVLGEEHPDTLLSRDNLAQQIGWQGRHKEAEAEFRSIWEIRRRPNVLGEEHPDTLVSRGNLAFMIGKQGGYKEAEAMYRAIWEIRRRPDVLGEEHPDTLTTRNNLALQIGKQGRYQEAEAMHRAIWEIRRRPDVLGEQHIYVLKTEFHIAKLLDVQGKNAEADRWLDGLGSRMVSQVSQDHNYVVELREYMENR